MRNEADIAVLGGSGFYDFAEGEAREIRFDTPYGAPSETITLMTVAGKRVAFLPRHGRRHSIPPHGIPFRANLWAIRELGATRVIAPSAVGSLQAGIAPGDFVINDQFVDRTSGRADTYYNGPVVTHVSTAEPYCPDLRARAIAAAREVGVTVHEAGTGVTIQGPRFSTKAESRWFTQMGWHVVNMTQYPEVTLARELSLCYVNISLVTDYDAGVVVDEAAVRVTDVLEVLRKNTENVKKVILAMIRGMDEWRVCDCAESLKFARME